jgi:hypothetical protein
MTSVFHRNSVDFVLGFVNRVAPGCDADVSEGHATSTCHIPCSPLLLGSDSPFSPPPPSVGPRKHLPIQPNHSYSLLTSASRCEQEIPPKRRQHSPQAYGAKTPRHDTTKTTLLLSGKSQPHRGPLQSIPRVSEATEALSWPHTWPGDEGNKAWGGTSDCHRASRSMVSRCLILSLFLYCCHRFLYFQQCFRFIKMHSQE